MSKNRFREADVSTLVRLYAEAAAAQGQASATGQNRIANKNHDIVTSVYRELRARGPEAQRALLPLLDYIDDNVRVWAAAHALQFAPERGEPVLESVARRDRPGLASLTAETVLSEWRKGALSFP